jgi:hypothetical protein
MKKIFLTLFSISSILSMQAQNGYIRIGTGYSWNAFQKTGQVLTFQPGANPDPAYSTILPLVMQDLSDTSGGQFIANVGDGYARGVNLTITGGYMINPYFGVEMGIAYLKGANIKSTSKTSDSPLLGVNSILNTTTSSFGLSLMPALYLRAAKPEAKVAPFARLGLSLPVYGATHHELNIDAPNSVLGNVASVIKVKTESTVSLGVNGSVGINYTPIPLISIFAEMNGQYLFVRPQKSTIEKYDLTINGSTQNTLAGLTKYSTVTEFVEKIDENSNTERFGKGRIASPVPGGEYVDEDKPRQALRTGANFSAIGFNVGVVINMSKKIFESPLK